VHAEVIFHGVEDLTATLVRMSVAAIILAAGASRRLRQPKQLVPYGGETLLSRTIRLAGEAGAARVFVVLGAQAETIRASVNPHKATIVINENWEQGIASSIHAGLHALSADAEGVLILSCDQPRLTAEHLRALMDAFTAQSASAIVASAYAGVHGVPAIFPCAAFPNLLALEGDKGARALLVRPPCPLIALPFAGGETDIDEPDDLAQLN
jgi:CTP:molybdopterin cytidylyltransferase MocA